MIKVSIAGVTGFTGEMLLNILGRHPEVEVRHFISRQPGRRIGDLYPAVNTEALTENLTAKVIEDTDVAFLCLPHTESAKTAFRFLSKNKTVIDLSADFRLKNAALYRKTYGIAHPHPALLSKAVYGLCEFYRDKIRQAKLIANPGCYPTASLIGLLPAVIEGIGDEKYIIIDAKSGVSGAGRKLASEYLFNNVHENTRAYNVGIHRHQPEIEQEIHLISARRPGLTFAPHILPQKTGMLTTIYMRMKTVLKEETIVNLYKKFYRGERFVQVLEAGSQPATAEVRDTNNVRLGIAVDKRSHVLIVTSAIDNLIKGASGQAVQNMNIMLGFDEDTAL